MRSVSLSSCASASFFIGEMYLRLADALSVASGCVLGRVRVLM
jgi:hypothetical protein